MTAILWIGVVFLALLLIFLMVAYFLGGKLTEPQLQILRLLSSLCAGFAGAFITGEASFQLTGNVGLGEVVASGSGGIALLLAVWYGFGRSVSREGQTVYPNQINYAVPVGATFRTVVDRLAQQDGSTATLNGFTEEELKAELRSQTIRAETSADAIAAVGTLAQTIRIRPYSVERRGTAWVLTPEEQ